MVNFVDRIVWYKNRHFGTVAQKIDHLFCLFVFYFLLYFFEVFFLYWGVLCLINPMIADSICSRGGVVGACR